jgi:preprotein translocase YajC subunit
MPDYWTLLAIGGPSPGGEANPMGSLFLMVSFFAIFYFVLFLPSRQKQKKLEALLGGLKPGDAVVVTPGILGVVVSIEGETVQVRVDDKTNARIKVLKSAIAGLQEPPSTEKK